MRGYKEEGTTSTPFDMVVLNDLDRFNLFGDVIDRLPKLGSRAAYAKQAIDQKLLEHKQYIDEQVMTCRKSPAGAGVSAGRQASGPQPKATTSDEPKPCSVS